MASLSGAAGTARDKIVHCSFNENQLICSLEEKKGEKKRGTGSGAHLEPSAADSCFPRVTWRKRS